MCTLDIVPPCRKSLSALGLGRQIRLCDPASTYATTSIRWLDVSSIDVNKLRILLVGCPVWPLLSIDASYSYFRPRVAPILPACNLDRVLRNSQPRCISLGALGTYASFDQQPSNLIGTGSCTYAPCPTTDRGRMLRRHLRNVAPASISTPHGLGTTQRFGW